MARYSTLGLEHAKDILACIGHSDSGCWEWEGKLTPEGYGEYSVDDGEETLAAHKAMFVITRGTVPEDSALVHTCDEKKCCNPSHMKVVETRACRITPDQINQMKTWMGSDCEVSPNVASRKLNFQWDTGVVAHRMTKLGIPKKA